jgi:hypothetical protein
MKRRILVLAVVLAAVAAVWHYYRVQDQIARWCLESDSSIPQKDGN